MAILDNSQESIPCRHCGSPVRAGMIRCRECNQSLVEPQDEFIVAPQVTMVASPRCPGCRTPIENGVDECPKCASALLDELLKGPAAAPPVAASQARDPESSSSLRPREVGSLSTPAGEWVPLREIPTPQSRVPSGQLEPAAEQPAGRASAAAEFADDLPGLSGEVDQTTPPRRKATSTKGTAERKRKKSQTDSEVETSTACAALLASLATADVPLRIEIATALGKLGDQLAVKPLERHLTDEDVRVRRAVAAALVQLGHPNGKSLLEVAERKPAAEILTSAKSTPASKRQRSGGGLKLDGAVLKKFGVAIVTVGIISGGVWFFMNSNSNAAAPRSKKSKKKKAAVVQVVPRTIARSPYLTWFS